MKATTETPPVIIKKSVIHKFTQDERNGLNTDLLAALDAKTNSENEFDSIKASYKARITEAEAKVGTVAAALRAGWEMRLKEVEVRFRPADKKKDFYLPGEHVDGPNSPILLPTLISTEDMTTEDFEQDLIRAEAAFSDRTEILLWAAGTDNGKLVLGKIGGRWFSAVRGNIGKYKLEERLDSEQRSYKIRWDAVSRAGKRCLEWIETTLGKEQAKGFAEPLQATLDLEKEKVE